LNMPDRFKIAIILISVPFLEVGLTVLLTKTLGATLTYSLFAIPTAIGLIIQWFRWKRIKPVFYELLKKSEVYAENKNFFAIPAIHRQMQEVASFWVSVLLLLIPGFVTDVIAFYLIFSPARRGNDEQVGHNAT
jgi:UPF0716 family protein affecting phage T7 exclusion